MKFVISVFAGLALLFAVRCPANELNDMIRTSQAKAELDRLTQTPETFNDIQVLEGGRNSWQVRQELISKAESFAFVMVPFWYYDSVGRRVIELLGERKKDVPGFEVKVIQGWTSPFLSAGGRDTKSALKKVADQYLLWNSPFWQRRFSFSLFTGHLHDKFLIVDGRRMILGGMNISDEDAQAGTPSMTYKDVDLLIEGPAVSVATELFLKINQLGHYLASSESFPPFKDEEIKAFQEYFYRNKEDHDFKTVTSEPNPKPPFMETHRVHIPLHEVLSNPKYFPEVRPGSLSTRIIYDNPLIDRDPLTKKQYSKFFRTLAYLVGKTKQTVWITSPYLTFDRELMDLFVAAARGLDVRIVTNSRDATDQNLNYYKAQLSHYPALLRAGIKIYEWLGSGPLKKVESGCKITSWPGNLLHHKIVLFDQSVVMVGSNNINRRSKVLNNEVMAMIDDVDFAKKFVPIFERSFKGEPQTVSCKDGTKVVPLVEQITPERATSMIRLLKVKKPVWKYPFGGF